MAFPTFVNKGTFASSINAITPGLPAGIATGNLLLLFVESANEAIAAPAGWIELTNSPQGTGTAGAAGGVRLAVFSRTATASETAPTVADTGNHQTAIIMAFANVAATTPITATAGSVGAATTAMVFPSVTTTVADSLIVLAAAMDTDANSTATMGAITNAALGSITEQHDQTVNAGAGGGLAIATGTKATIGATGTSTATGSTSVTHAYMSIVIVPVNIPPTVTLGSPVNAATVANPTPTLAFTGTDNEANDIEYNVQIDTVNTFDSVKTSPVLPSALGGTSLAAWFKADAIIATDGSSLTSWADSSSNGNNLTTVGANAPAPIYRATGGPNSLPYVDHTVAAGGLYSDISTGMPTGDYTYFMVAQSGSTALQSFLNAHGVPSGTAEIRLSNLNVEILESGVVSLKVSTAALAANTWTLILVTFTAIGSIVHFDIGDTIEDYAIGGTTAFIQNGINYGSYEQNSAFFNGKMAEIGVYSSVLSSTDLATLKNYLITKYWGVPRLSKLSVSDTGFLDITNGADTHPFASGDQLDYTVQAGDALADGTYYWRVAGIDPLGSNNYGAWSTIWSFTVPTGSGIKVWNGTAWVVKPVKVWNGTAWVVKPVKVWNGTAWVVKG